MTWDWPNQQVVRADGSGPGRDTPPGLTFLISIEYIHQLDVGLSTTWKTQDAAHWNLGDGRTIDNLAGDEVDHSYTKAGTYLITATCLEEHDELLVTVTTAGKRNDGARR